MIKRKAVQTDFNKVDSMEANLTQAVEVMNANNQVAVAFNEAMTPHIVTLLSIYDPADSSVDQPIIKQQITDELDSINAELSKEGKQPISFDSMMLAMADRGKVAYQGYPNVELGYIQKYVSFDSDDGFYLDDEKFMGYVKENTIWVYDETE